MEKFTVDDLEYLECGSHPYFMEVEPVRLIDQNRWSILKSMVIKRLEDGTFWRMVWRSPATEYQDEPFDPQFTQVYPKMVEMIVYDEVV